MATDWIQVAVNIPGVGDRAYVLSQHINGPIGFGVTLPPGIYSDPCLPSPVQQGPASLLPRQCMYFTADSWHTNMPMEGIYPQVGQFVRLESYDINNPTVSFGPEWVICQKVIEIIDEDTFNNDTNVECYNQNVAGTCSNQFGGPYPDPAGCRYNNSIINPLPGPTMPGGSGMPAVPFVIAYPQPYPAGPWTTTIVNTCAECWPSVPPPFNPNIIINCCDPTEIYQISSSVLSFILLLGVTGPIETFRAELNIGGTNTGYKCWHVEESTTPTGPFVTTIVFSLPHVTYIDCTDINTSIQLLGLPECCPPIASWNCLSPGNCQDPGTGLGQYSTLAACQTNCQLPPSWNCLGPGNCQDPGTGLGQYSTLAACNVACPPLSWNCLSPGNCQDPGNGTGMYPTLAACNTACPVPGSSWDCTNPGTSSNCHDPGTGLGQFTTLTACQNSCITPMPVSSGACGCNF